MNKKILIVVGLILVQNLITSCKKDEDSKPNNIEVSPADPNALTGIIVFPNSTTVDNLTLPESSTSGGPVISNFDNNISYSAGSKVFLPLEVSASSSIKGIYFQVKGASKYFNIPINTSISSGIISVPFDLSVLVGSGNFIVLMKIYDAQGKVSSPIEISINITKSSNCGITKVSGGQGLTSNLFKIPSTAGKIKISYDTYVVKDKIDVFQNGEWIGGTGPTTVRSTLRKALNCSVATEVLGYFGKKSEFLFDYDPANGTDIEVVVSGCELGGTLWEYTFSCPGTFATPSLTTNFISGIGQNSANSGGFIASDGGSSITAKGVVWGLSPNPTVSLVTKTVNGSGSGSFTSSITGLSPNTKYYVRAYATNGSGTAYGNELNFTTSGASVNLDINGKWLYETGYVITISGTGGAFTVFNSSWQTAANMGLVSLGSLKLRNITPVNSTKWNCQELWIKTVGGAINSVLWSSDGTITMSPNGQTITVTSTSPVTGIVGTGTFTRQP